MRHKDVFLAFLFAMLLLALFNSTLTSQREISTLHSTIEHMKNADQDRLMEQYARGMYDACADVLATQEKCLDAIRQGLDSGWYTQKSPGFNWPILRPNEQTN